MLARLRIRGKLAVLLIAPLVAIVLLTVVVVVDRVGQAGRAADTARTARVAGDVGALIQDLQQERLMAVGYLVQVVGRSRLLLQTAAVTDRVTNLRLDYAGDLSPEVADAIDDVQSLAGLRAALVSGSADVDGVLTQFTAVTGRLIDALRLMDAADATTAEGRQLLALDALLRVDEGNSAGAALMTVMVATRAQRDLARYAANAAAVQPNLDRFTASGTPEQVDLYGLVTAAFASRVGGGFVESVGTDPAAAIADLRVATLFPSLESYIALGRFVEKRIVTDVTATMTDLERRQTTTAYGLVAGMLVLLLLVILLSTAIARTVARPLTLLTASAARVAQVTEDELVRVADDESAAPEPVRLERITVGGRDEIGDLARTFERVQQTAAQLVERQVASRRNVAQMFGHVGRRTQNLVGRQLGLIDQLERDETEPNRLRQLYRLDHVASRLRRNASSLVVLSGGTGTNPHLAPLALADAVRLALGEIEEYDRVDVQLTSTIMLAPAVISDLVLMLAELMENATSNSPPHTRVTVTTGESATDVRVSIVDHGIGMPAERLTVENARLERRERIDLAPTEVLGLFVVGRLARRHGLRVSLSDTPGGGVTATIVVGRELLDGSAAPEPQSRETIASVVDIGALTRATHSIDGRQPWNAFAAPRTLAAVASPPAIAAVVAPLDADATAETPALLRQPSRQGQGLRRRVPGAQLSAGTQAAGTPAQFVAAPPDPSSAQALVEAFEDGVRRAQHDVTAPPADQTPPLPPPPSLPPPPQFQSPPPRPATAGRNLSRRVPGATLQDPGAIPRPGLHPVESQSSHDPDSARKLVEEFESGVLRALREVRSEGSSQ
ncbi:nitrate- and nitrite sensing domain-containing protein [Dactylosporangium siamense]|uniref:histidine kinase n=1 Tax=Dactylosporangium siamense TaxID=685454 RepID=A0A919PN36_9ACTN|nr:sensor histidine kinase [Dactylosporangium siamense]GIG45188.1 histidine kinase [Dactylosporangium siamense]